MRDVSRREFLHWAAAGAAGMGVLPRTLLAAAAAAEAAPGGKRPNILYIMADDHDEHAISACGSRINKTPNIDRIAAGGMRLRNCFCTNSICGPSRAVLLTGKYSHKNGFFDNDHGKFDGSQQTFPKLLQQAGYQTAVVGKWHLGSNPTGFDYWNILPGQGVYKDPPTIEMGKKTPHTGYVTDIITDISLEWLAKRDKTKPFMLLCHHKAPHRNWVPDAKHATMYDGQDIPEPETFNDDYSNRSPAAAAAEMRIDKHLTPADVKGKPPEGLTPEQVKKWKYQRYIKDYLRCVASVDDNVGRMLDWLDKEGLADDTIVIYTSDQGFYLGDHNWFDKRFMYEPSLRMPFLVRYPREIKPGSTSDDMVVNIDFAPTFLDFAGAAIPADIQGRSARPVLAGKGPADWRTSMYYHYYEFPGVHMVKRHYGVRNKRHKLIHYYHDIDAWELFDLEKDPNELKSVYADSAYAAVVTEMKAELDRLRKLYDDTGDPLKSGPPIKRAGA